jgi:UDP-N-acetylglucosamine diphosphorylase / glucose-1-phosphate thymidylyltransferase / UDP-N-acetylgalactosamine diphosphorylase / glucosamine-1-phosphate N-acetyltransferase / galactosamine-1-phosphate N-acetyltransferase
MQIIILAAGKGTRMGELTNNTPKPLLLYKGISLLEHKFKVLPSNTTEVIIVIGYLGDKIKKHYGDTYNNIPIRYVEQIEMNGTAGALWLCRDFINGSFMVLMSDDIYVKEDLELLSKTPHGEWAILSYPDMPGIKAGKIVKDESGNLKEIFEDFGGTSPYNLIYTGVCVLTPHVFTKEMFKLSNGEYGLPQSFTQFAQEKNIKVFETNNWIRITAPGDLL